jgi:hypothetical protein
MGGGRRRKLTLPLFFIAERSQLRQVELLLNFPANPPPEAETKLAIILPAIQFSSFSPLPLP